MLPDAAADRHDAARDHSTMKVLVTGGAGFIGSHCCDLLLARGHEVVCVDNFSKGRPENVAHLADNSRFSLVQLDVLDRAALFAAGAGDVDAVLHLAAAKIPRYGNALPLVTSNVEGAQNALDLCVQQRAKFVLASTSDVYGKSDDLPFREDGDLVLGPSTSRRWAYAVSKLLDEHMALAYQDEYGLAVSMLRFFGAYGERQHLDWWGGPQGVFLQAIDEGRPLEVHGDGRQQRAFVHVSDLARGTVAALERPEANGEILNVGAEEEISILELAQLMHELSGVGGEPEIVLVPYASFSPNYQDVRRRVPDLRKSREVLGYEPTVGLREGLTRLWSWYRSERGRTAG
jgi:UDP-glucose 4-epimerase